MSAAEPNQHIGVALSGGGHRAALFALGALRYLVDAGKGRELASVSSVSGGSITNGAIAQRANLKTAQPEDFRLTVKQIASQITRRGTVFAWFVTRLYCALAILLVVLLIAVSFAPALPCWPFGWWTVAIWLAVLAALIGWAKLRSRVAARALAKTVLRHERSALDEINDDVAHVLCATDLQAGLAVCFSKSFVYSWEPKWGRPNGLPLAQAVQASAAFPFGFNVVSLPLSRFYSSHPWAGISEFKLLDGGVYGNMGTEWMFETQRRRAEAGAPPLHPVDEVVVVNASAGMESTPRPKLRWPLFGEIFAILAVKDVMYDQTTSVRRRLLHLRNLVETARARDQLNPRARVADDALRGATVQIGRSPFAVPDGFKADQDAAGTRANDAIQLLSDEQNAGEADRRQHWETERVDNSKVKTTLFKYKIRPDRAVSLIRCAASPAGSPVRGRAPGRDQGIRADRSADRALTQCKSSSRPARTKFSASWRRTHASRSPTLPRR
ncbi:MAG: patatin-like phospholipase family protein [Mycobacterium sp.]